MTRKWHNPNQTLSLKHILWNNLIYYKIQEFTERLIRPFFIDLDVHFSLLFVFISSKKKYGPHFYHVLSGSRLFTYAQY